MPLLAVVILELAEELQQVLVASVVNQIATTVPLTIRKDIAIELRMLRTRLGRVFCIHYLLHEKDCY